MQVRAGGEFVSNWPGKDVKKVTAGNPLGKVLSTIAEMIGATISPELLCEVGAESGDNIKSPNNTETQKEETSSGDTKSDGPDYAASAGSSQSNSPIREEAMLFGDDRRVSGGAKSKPQYRVRARRRASKKRTTYKLSGQGTLFETDSAGQSAA